MGEKQLELFTQEDMLGLYVPNELNTEQVRAYLWAIRYVANMDDGLFFLVKKGCDEPTIWRGRYYYPFVYEKLDETKLMALRDCLNLRASVKYSDNYIRLFPMSIWKPQITDPHSFIVAKNVYQERFINEYREKAWWIPELSVEQLLKIAD